MHIIVMLLTAALLLATGCQAPENRHLHESAGAIKAGYDLTCGYGARRVRALDGRYYQPESCAWNATTGRWLVSNMATRVFDKGTIDGVGWIQQVNYDGSAFFNGDDDSIDLQLGGAAALSTPLGIAVDASRGYTYVVDASGPPLFAPFVAVFEASQATGDYKVAIDLQDSTGNRPVLANDVAVGALTGTLYVTDSHDFSTPNAGGSIWRVENTTGGSPVVTEWLVSPTLNHVNGIVVDEAGGKIYVNTLGSNLNPSAPPFDGGIYSVDINTKAVTKLTALAGLWDGLAMGPSNTLFAGELVERRIYGVNLSNLVSYMAVDLSPYLDQIADFDVHPGGGICVADLRKGAYYVSPPTLGAPKP